MKEQDQDQDKNKEEKQDQCGAKPMGPHEKQEACKDRSDNEKNRDECQSADEEAPEDEE